MHTGRFMCVCVRPGPTGLGGSVGVVGMCELMLVSAYVWEVGLWLCTSRLPAYTLTYTGIPGDPTSIGTRQLPRSLVQTHTQEQQMCVHSCLQASF